MLDENIYQYAPITSSNNLKAFVRNLGIDLVGIADLRRLDGMPIGVPSTIDVLNYFLRCFSRWLYCW